jgi:FdrA protein
VDTLRVRPRRFDEEGGRDDATVLGAARRPPAGAVTASRVEVRKGTYHDSVTLMQVSRQAEGLAGVEAAAVVAATPVNLELLARQGFAVDTGGLGPSDLVVCVRAADEDTAGQALERVTELLAGVGRGDGATGAGMGAGSAAVVPRSLRAAVRRDPDLSLAVLSVPGRHLHYEITEALQAGLHVFCFSDGLDPATEAACKRAAAERGLLLLGPDCGTAILDGVGYGFANAVRRGPVGVVGASGTGIQEVTCLLDAAGVGISHAVGVGGRDLSPEVGGIMTLRALDLLAADPATERLVVVSKPPDPRVARRVADAATATGKPAVLAFPGMADPPALPEGVWFAGSLEAAAAWALRAQPEPGTSEGITEPRPPAPSSPGAIRGLFSGGTLCYEAMAVVAGVVGRVASNIPLRPEWRLADPHRSEGHTFVDFGDDAMTEGRAHPMIDPGLRNERFRREAADPETGVVLLDVVLGYGAHPDPAGELAPLVERALAEWPGGLSVVVSLCGAAGDPQGLDGQAATLRAAGALVTRSCAQAARLALAAAGLDGDRR